MNNRETLAQAAITVISRDGFDSMSIRTVAREAHVAPGTAQHHFKSREELLVAAFERTVHTVSDRVARVSDSGPVREALVGMLSQALPLDEERRSEAVVWVALSAAAATNSHLAVVHEGALATFREHLEELLSAAVESGELGRGTNPTDCADTIMAIVDGLTLRGIVVGCDRRKLVDSLRAGVSAVLPA